jgi:large subunit ribosomal protein L32
MPNPKRKHSKSRTGKRRAHDFLATPSFGTCPNCGKPRPPHRVCPECGFYRGRVVIEMEEKK